MLTVIPTIDVEAVHGKRPFEQLVLGDFGGDKSWGVFRQAEIFSKFGIAATFFVDVYEYTMWGEKPLRDVCRRLIDLGQDVQLHTHPGWRIDDQDSHWLQEHRRDNSYLGPEFDFMAKLSFEQQKQVLEHGIELLEKWTGHRPIAHRSGGYSINQDTIAALSMVGIPVDSSMNCSHSNSTLTWSQNAIIEREGLVELPVTVGEYVANAGVGSVKYPFYRRLMKTDLDIFDTEEFVCYARQALDQDLRLMNLFMHSYSLVDLTKGWSRLNPDPEDAVKLETTIEHLAEMDNIQFMSCKSFYEAYKSQPEIFQGSDSVPEIPLKLPKMIRYGGRRLSRYKKKMSTLIEKRLTGNTGNAIV